MGQVHSVKLDKLDQLEQEYSKNKRLASANLRYRIGENEEVIFCYYEDTSLGSWSYWILTNTKLIINHSNIPKMPIEIKLDSIKQISPRLGFLDAGINIITSESYVIFAGVNDKEWLQNISKIIQKAKANYDVRFQSSLVKIKSAVNQNLVADQLEKLADLYKAGVLTDDEYKKAKDRVLTKN